jgi:isoamylase
MLVAGDEVRRTQGGNNNPYCQDNETSWFDWTLPREEPRSVPLLETHDRVPQEASGAASGTILHGHHERARLERRYLAWDETQQPRMDDPNGRALAMTPAGFAGDADIHIVLNMHSESLNFELPEVPGRIWLKAVDTAQAAPLDIADPGREYPVAGHAYTVQERSVAVLVSGAAPQA